MRAGRNRLVTGELSGTVVSNYNTGGNGDGDDKPLSDVTTGSQYRYRMGEYIFDHSLIDVATSGAWVTGVYVSQGGATKRDHIILDAHMIVEPITAGGQQQTLEQESFDNHQANNSIRCELPLAKPLNLNDTSMEDGAAADNTNNSNIITDQQEDDNGGEQATSDRLEIVGVGNGDFILVAAGDLYYIKATFQA